jgi:hypothetical protein
MALVFSTRQEWTSTRSSDYTFPPQPRKSFQFHGNKTLHNIQVHGALDIQGLPKVHPKTLKDLSPKTFPFKVRNLDNKTNLEVRVL